MTKQDLFIEVEQGVHLHIIEKGSGKPILLLPGLPMSGEIFQSTTDFLAAQGFRCISITPRGFGKSDRAENYDMDTQAKDIHTIIEKLQLTDISLAGYSYGGVLAAYYQARYMPKEVKNLILISSNVPKYTKGEDFPYGLDLHIVNQLVTLSEEHLFEMLDVYGPVFQLDETFMPRSIGDRITAINRQTDQKAMTAGVCLLRDVDLRPMLKNIDVPTTILHGKEDGVVPFEIAQQAHVGIENSTLIPFNKGGHWFLFTETETFHSELLKALE